MKSLQGKITYDSVTGQPSFGVSLGDIQRPEFTLEEIFNYLDNAGMPCLVAIDEFQQINEYEDGNVEALLRGHIQKMKNCHFVFAGSKRSIMSAMFQSPARPFYKSADPLELKALDKDIYSDFVGKMFNEYGKRIAKAVVEYVYDLLEGYTYYMQRVFNEAFASIDRGEECSIEVIRMSIDNILLMNEVQFAELMSSLTENQNEFCPPSRTRRACVMSTRPLLLTATSYPPPALSMPPSANSSRKTSSPLIEGIFHPRQVPLALGQSAVQ